MGSKCDAFGVRAQPIRIETTAAVVSIRCSRSCAVGLLGWPASESGRLCHGYGGHEGATAAGAC